MPISNFFIPKILKKITALGMYDEDDIDMMRYSLQAILWEIEKLIYLCIIFACFQKLDYFLITAVALLTIRTSAGGYHSRSSWGCFAVTFIAFLMAILLLPAVLPINGMLLLAISAIALGITLLLAPIYSEQKEALLKNKGTGNKKWIAVAFTLIWLALIFFNKIYVYRDAVLYIILLQNLQLLFEYLRRTKMRNSQKLI